MYETAFVRFIIKRMYYFLHFIINIDYGEFTGRGKSGYFWASFGMHLGWNFHAHLATTLTEERVGTDL